MSFFDPFDYNSEYTPKPEVKKKKKVYPKSRVPLGFISVAEKLFLEDLQQEHKNKFYFDFIESIGGYHAVIMSEEDVWAPWIKYMLKQRLDKASNMNKTFLTPKEKTKISVVNEGPSNDFTFIREDIYSLLEEPGHIRFKLFIDPNK